MNGGIGESESTLATRTSWREKVIYLFRNVPIDFTDQGSRIPGVEWSSDFC